VLISVVVITTTRSKPVATLAAQDVAKAASS